MTPSPGVTFLGHNHLLPIPMHKQQQETRYEKEDAIHNPERKARLQHRTRLIRIQGKGLRSTNTVRSKGNRDPGSIVGEAGAVCGGYATKFVDAGDEGTNEAEVDEGNEDGGITCRFAPEEGYDGPDGTEGGDDEEGSLRFYVSFEHQGGRG